MVEEKKHLEDLRTQSEQLYSNRLSKAKKIMSGLLYNMPETRESVPIYLKSVETLMDKNLIDFDLRVNVLMPFLPENIRLVMLNQPSGVLESYDSWKKHF